MRNLLLVTMSSFVSSVRVGAGDGVAVGTIEVVGVGVRGVVVGERVGVRVGVPVGVALALSVAEGVGVRVGLGVGVDVGTIGSST